MKALWVVVCAVAAFWFWSSNDKRLESVKRLFPTPQESWQQQMDAEAAKTTSPPKIELPPAMPDHVRVDEIKAYRIWSPDGKASHVDLIQAKYLWVDAHPGAATESYEPEIILLKP